MATYTVYRQRAGTPDTPSPAPASVGITFNDAVTTGFASIGQLLNFLQRHDHRGFNYLGTTDGGTTFPARADDKGGV